VLAVFARSIELVAAECSARIGSLPVPLDRLRFIVDYLVRTDPAGHHALGRNVRRSSALCREHMRLAESRPEDLRVALRPLIQLIAEQIAAGMREQEVREGDPEELANLVYNVVSTTVHAAVLAQEAHASEPADQAKLAAQLWAFVQGGIAA
jgi:hypothetical protein